MSILLTKLIKKRSHYLQHFFGQKRFVRRHLKTFVYKVNKGDTQDAVITNFPDQSILGTIKVPPLSDCKHFVNLTNGIEAIPVLTELNLPYSFVRIQSTFCEQRRWDQLLGELDPNLLTNLALGHCCLVYDYGSRNRKRGVPRAIWYGLEFIRFALNYLWLEKITDSYLRGPKVNKSFERYVNNLESKTKKKLMYYQRYIADSITGVRLYGVYNSTEYDDELQFYRQIVDKYCSPNGKAIMQETEQASGQLSKYHLKLFLGGIGHQDVKSLFVLAEQ